MRGYVLKESPPEEVRRRKVLSLPTRDFKQVVRLGKEQKTVRLARRSTAPVRCGFSAHTAASCPRCATP